MPCIRTYSDYAAEAFDMMSSIEGVAWRIQGTSIVYRQKR